ncbi:ABC transporter ATP-binding protein [Halorubrum ezzemoulense]|uniref:ABC transporter ATP-binding protein n=1 Tax=Halorubrum ezzemoulense TaxID=337243 RepID=UPI0023314A93|nr:ABC transporter ATP-binding protein [Halorubrum ezzemoulense]MDB9253815.1 ABC transporter ATP-binding protein [Halorubrum ezzemoulense]MDB9257361.1 ABC transporter ATP-binding protein [Halorubrum ezzemoulense]MDB9277986.1 ABC transporter ATP-binding protein [Halorubrum ezzemoulense]
MSRHARDDNVPLNADATSGRDLALEVENLRTVFHTEHEQIHAVDGISFNIRRGETVGLVGESGSGKSVTARSILGLIESPGEIDPASAIRFEGDNITEYTESEYESIRGDGIAMVFQDPLSTLNPVYTVGNQIKEALSLHQDLRGTAATERAIELLEEVGIPDAARRVTEYPHQFSGGMRQRAVIAMALACAPEVLICDEPTTALDVTIQAQIIDLLMDIQAERDLSILFITHDMGVIAEVADRVNVMYAGEIVESAPVEPLFAEPKHPYTRGLLRSIPSTQTSGDRLETIKGEVPTPNEPASSCRFAPRCPKSFEECSEVAPIPTAVGDDPDHDAACLLYPESMTTDEAVAHHRPADDGGEQ